MRTRSPTCSASARSARSSSASRSSAERLRRQTYDLNERGLFNVEYADVSWDSIRFHGEASASRRRSGRANGGSTRDAGARDALEIRFPRVEGYRVELPKNASLRNSTMIRHWCSRPILSARPRRTIRASSERRVDVGMSVSRISVPPRSSSTSRDTCSDRMAGRRTGSPSCTSSVNSRPSRASGWRTSDLQRRHFPRRCLIIRSWRTGMLSELPPGSRRSWTEKPIVAMLDPYNPEWAQPRHVHFTTSRTRDGRRTANVSHEQGDTRQQLGGGVLPSGGSSTHVCVVREKSQPRIRSPVSLGARHAPYRPDFIVRVEDGHGEDDLLNLVVEIKGYRREDAK